MGMFNLSNREALRLFYSWNFEDDTGPGAGNVGGHHSLIYPPTGQRCAITNPGRATRTPKRAYEKGAAIIGVPVKYFMMGPEKAKGWLDARIEEIEAEEKANDPLGIASYAATHTADTAATASEKHTLTPNDEKVLNALLEATAPVTQAVLMQSTGIPERTVRDSLTKLTRNEVVFRIGQAPARGSGGRPAWLYWHENEYPETATAPEPDPTPAIEENDVPQPLKTPLLREAEASVALDRGGDGQTFALEDSAVLAGSIGALPPQPQTDYFRVGETPSGEIILQGTEDGQLYIARPLIEKKGR